MDIEEQLFKQLKELSGSKTVLVGIGNTLKGDDGAGPLVCEQLKRANVTAELIDAGTVPENYIQTIIRKAPQNLLVIDAIDFGAPAGTVKIFQPEQFSAHAISTHTLSPRLFVDLVRKDVEINVYFIGIQPAQTQLGQPVCSQVSQAVRRLSDALTQVFPPTK